MSSVAIDEALVRRLVAEQFPQWQDETVEQVLPGGHDNRTFRLGRELSVRLPSAETYAAHVGVEHEWLPRLRAQLSLPTPEIVGTGSPCKTFPWPWTVLRWLPGQPLGDAAADREPLAVDLAAFLVELRSLPCVGGPLAGRHNFHRGGDLAVYDAQTREQVSLLLSEDLRRGAVELWEAALDARNEGLRTWIHGDVAAGNLLFEDGRLAAVIDFGQLAVGDPSCDYVAAWTVFSGRSRELFRSAADVDEATWTRARGWALWKELLQVDAATPAPSAHLLDLLSAA
ncbi:MAG: aminoglycoside phosphotransferase family protein [Acidobacteriota bacterium]